MKKTTANVRRIASANTEIMWLPLDRLFVDRSMDLQRPYDERRAQSIADRLDLDVLGVIEVSERPGGRYHIMEGQHRVGALRLAGFTNELVECKVHRGLSPSKEAADFNGLNDFRAPRAFDRFLVRVTQGDPVAIGVDSILMEFGWRLVSGDAEGCFAAVDKAEKVYVGHGTTNKERGPENFRATMGTLTQAWGRKPINANGYIVAGLGLFYARYGDQIDRPSLVKRLAQFPGGADNYLGKARGIREFRSGTLSICVAELTTTVYNKRRGAASKLEDWR
jgi:hypothetical protein